MAKCYEAPVTMLKPSGYICICAKGLAGNGIGADGCYAGNHTACFPNKCLNGGQCVVNELLKNFFF